MKKFTAFLLGACFSLASAQMFAAETNEDTSTAPSSSYESSYETSYEASYPNQNQGGRIQWCEDYSQARQFATKSSKPILLLFTGSGWCPACMKLERQVLSNPQFAQAVKDKFIFVKLDFTDNSPEGISSSPNKPLLDRFGIKSFPTIVVLDPNGQRLFDVPYRTGGPQTYAQELIQKLNQSSGRR